MATVINNPQPIESHSNGVGFLIGIILLAMFVLFLFLYALPAIRNSVAGPQVNVPSNLNVHVSK